MKKFLLSLFAMAAIGGSAMAEDVTFDFAANDYGLTRYSDGSTYIDNGTTVTTGGVTIALNKDEGKNGWRLWTDGLRAYKSSGCAMTVSASQNISAVKFTQKSGVVTGYTVNGGANTNVNGTEFTATTSGTSVNLGFTVGANGAIYTVTVTLGEGGGEVNPNPGTDPDPVETEGEGTEAKPYTCADVIALGNPGTKSYVIGYIVGVINNNKLDQTAEGFAKQATNVAIAASQTETDLTKIVPVQLPTGDIRAAVNLADNPTNYGKTLTVCGDLLAYFNLTGVKNASAYTLTGEGIDPPAPVEPDVVTTEGEGTEAKPYTVADVIALIAGNNNPENVWVKGTIVGVMNYVDGTGNVFSATELTTNSNIVIAASATGYEDKIVAVQLPSGDVRTSLNLVDNPSNLGKEVYVCGNLLQYCGVAGVKNTSAYSLDGETPTPPTPSESEGDGTQANPYTIADVIALNNNGATSKWVTGYIVGVMNYVDGANVLSTTELTTNSNIVIAATTTGFETNYVAVQLPAGKVRDDLNLVDRPGNLGKEVSVCGDLIKYCGTWGVKNTSDYTIVGGLAPLPTAETESLTTFVEDQCTSNTKIKGTVTVFYQSPDKKYTFITDGETNIEVYGQMTNTYVNGDQLTGIIGKFSFYQNMPQMTPQLDSFGEATHGTPVEPATKVLASVQPNDYVLLKNVKVVETVGETSTTYTVVEGDTEYTLFDRFAIGGIKALDDATILGIGAIYGETKQIFPITITDTASIAEIISENGANVIYDLQGRRLAAPIRGINIINGHKVLVK